MLLISVKKNTTLVTIGWAKDKSQIFEVRKNVKETAYRVNSNNSSSSYTPLIMTVHPVIIITAQATIIVLMITQVQIAHRPIQEEQTVEVVIKQKNENRSSRLFNTLA